MPRWPTVALVATVIVGIAICLYLVVSRELSSTATLSVTLFLTILSVIGSWAASRFYYELSYGKNLKTFALKAAEKVNNLSNELDRLSAFLQQGSDDSDSQSMPEALISRDLRIEAATHIIATLKSVNDGALSDWQGVIGEEIEAQKEEREEREQDLRDLVDQVESLSLSVSGASTEREKATAALLSKIDSDLRVLTSQVSGVPVKRHKSIRQQVTSPCPSCSKPLEYGQKAREGSFKQFTCVHCGTKLLSEFKNGEYVMRVNAPALEEIDCPKCGEEFSGSVGIVPGQSVATFCPTCGEGIRLVRTKNGVNARLVAPQPVKAVETGHAQTEVTGEILEQVRRAAPPQPWPHGTQRKIAEELGLPSSLVGKAVKELMIRGVFKAQVEGRLFVPDPNQPEMPTTTAIRTNQNHEAIAKGTDG